VWAGDAAHALQVEEREREREEELAMQDVGDNDSGLTQAQLIFGTVSLSCCLVLCDAV